MNPPCVTRAKKSHKSEYHCLILEYVNALLADQRMLVNQSNVFGLVPLTAAVFSGNIDLFKALVSDKRTQLLEYRSS